ncbi:MAG: dTDP-4-dehydrorhamnose reductase [Bradyrhizobium sp.]|uniref:dTDP-4-dehydrorhamnose reductase n=1 Tax=Bradyrhizobium sp. TaxID=376 RepID=UPI00272F7137|nr:dTDP-4-dehydrorhamnose reductase [Bradyrhizobium sp.]MDP1867808.1 dTDP-4-dehydrorhamnose reductase [Bradyrhizobium sp.]
MKLLVIGRNGQLARGIVENADRFGVQVISAGRPDTDVTDRNSVEATVAREQFDAVVNAAAYTAVDKAESEPSVAQAVNAIGAEHVARACAANSIPIIHISTDYVFDGSKDSPYREDDQTGPINAYGRSKLEGEQRVADACARHVILRTAWVHSPWGGNFVKTMLRLAAERPAVGVVGDQQGSPTYAPHLAEAVLAIARRAIADPAGMPWGIYHAVGMGETSWFGVAREIFRCAREHGLPAAEVTAITTAEYPTPARRPANSRLNCDRLRQSFGLGLPDWRVGVQDCVARLAQSAGNRLA